MSEDIDIKVLLSPTPKLLKKGRGDRVRLIALHEVLPSLLATLGFPLIEYSDGVENPRIRDAHRYYVVGAAYKSATTNSQVYGPSLSLN